MLKKSFMMLALAMLVAVPFVSAQDAPNIEKVCLVTDVGRVNDGTFNQYAYDGMIQAAEDFDLETTFVETQAVADYQTNIDTCANEGFDIIITVGFLIGDATKAAAEAHPDIYFIGIDQFLEAGPSNYVGVQFREDQAGFLVGAMAALVANEKGAEKIAGVYGIDVPAVKRFRNGYEQGALYINPDWVVGENILGNYEKSFTDPAAGASTARQYIGEGAAVIFGAGGPTGSGAIKEAAASGVSVIGVDQDEYFTTFAEGATEGAENLITSALKRVDVGVYDMIQALVDGDLESFPGGSVYVLDVANGGITFAEAHDATVSPEITEEIEQLEMLLQGLVGVDPVTGDMAAETEEE